MAAILKYPKYYIPGITSILFIAILLMGENYPTYFLIGFSIFLIIGDLILPRDKEIQKFSYPFFLNLSLYINLPIIFILVLLIVSLFSHNVSQWYIDILDSYLYIDFMKIRNSYHSIDKISLIIQTGLSIGMLGTVPGHELTHRKKNKFDMSVGNWLLAFSWDCTFAIEHVYGHHKNVGFPEDPATGKRGENIYLFILKAIAQEQVGGWKLEISRLRRNGFSAFSFHNRMIIGYLRSVIITLLAFLIGGTSGMFYFLLLALLAKSLLEAINYVEHYGLVRNKGEPIRMRHSWNSNHCLSSLYLYNVTRHSDHHRASNLKFWELNPCDESAPNLPYGYLGMLYLLLITPFIYRKIMAKKLIDWDLNYANEQEKELITV
jgi:alkane 1-monooxygenase